MTTKELIAGIAQETGMRKADVARMLNATVEVTTQHLLEGHSVQIQNFGMLEVKTKNERAYVHPRTGVRSVVPEKRQISFKQNPALKEALNRK